MKKITFILLFGLISIQANEYFFAGEDSKPQKHWFFGIEGGAGLYDLSGAAIYAMNTRLLGHKQHTSTMSYVVKLTGGYQTDTGERSSFRFSFGLGGHYIERFKNTSSEYSHFTDGGGIGVFIVADELFDFVRNNNHRFGMLMGGGAENFTSFIHDVDQQESWAFLTGFFVLRVGFYTQIDNDVIDLVGTIPLGGFGLGASGKYFGTSAVNSTLTLGYKHLF